MVAEAVMKKEPDEDNHAVEERLEGRGWCQGAA